MPYKSVAGGVLLGTAALVLAGCGGSSSHTSSATQPSATQPSSAARPAVEIATSSKYGRVLTDAGGLTLYTATGDTPTHSGCTGTCLTLWPPLLLSSGQTQPVGGPGVNGLGTVTVPSGVQVTYHGQLLYTFSSDTAPGQVTGQNVTDSDGTWHVATAAGTNSSPGSGSSAGSGAPAVTTPPTTTAPSSGGASF